MSENKLCIFYEYNGSVTFSVAIPPVVTSDALVQLLTDFRVSHRSAKPIRTVYGEKIIVVLNRPATDELAKEKLGGHLVITTRANSAYTKNWVPLGAFMDFLLVESDMRGNDIFGLDGLFPKEENENG